MRFRTSTLNSFDDVVGRKGTNGPAVTHKTLGADVEALLRDIGEEPVPVVKRDYDVTQPIHTHVPVREFVREGWCKGDSKLYMHQWQFPLSDTAAAKLCHRSRPLPIIGDDLTAHWLDRCNGDSPFQYIFFG